MDVNNMSNKDGEPMQSSTEVAPSAGDVNKQKSTVGSVKKKRRRGKSKRKIMKPFTKVPTWHEKKYEKYKRNNRFRKLVLTKTHAPYNNNQFLMEIHKPEPENNFQILQTPSARTRDSSFSVDSDENYFYSLPEDEEDFLTKEFSSVYEDAQSERLSNMSKNELIQEYLLLEAKYENFVKRARQRISDDEKDGVDDETTAENTTTDKDTTGNALDLITPEDTIVQSTSVQELIRHIKEQEEQILDLKLANEKLKLENENLQQSHMSSSEDSESDSSSSTNSCSSSASPRSSPVNRLRAQSPIPHILQNGNHIIEHFDSVSSPPIVNGSHNNDKQSDTTVNGNDMQ